MIIRDLSSAAVQAAAVTKVPKTNDEHASSRETPNPAASAAREATTEPVPPPQSARKESTPDAPKAVPV